MGRPCLAEIVTRSRPFVHDAHERLHRNIVFYLFNTLSFIFERGMLQNSMDRLVARGQSPSISPSESSRVNHTSS